MLRRACRLGLALMPVGGLLALSGCGGGLLILNEFFQDDRPRVLPPLPAQGVQHARQAPIVDLDGTLHVGADVAPPAGALHQGGQYRGVSTSHGHVRNGIGASELIAYLEEDAETKAYNAVPEGFLARFGATPPTVLVAAGAMPDMLSDVVLAVQIINAALPRNWQLRLSAFPAPAGIDRPPNGEIHVEFAVNGDWPSRLRPEPTDDGDTCDTDSSGCGSFWWSDPIRTNDPEYPWVFEHVAGKAWIDHTRSTGTDRIETVVHEILHTLGRWHPDPARFPESIMRIVDETGRITSAEGVPGHLLHPLDREALLAVYGWLDPGDKPTTIASDLGPWASTSLHIRGDIDAVDGAAFGVAVRNGLSQPWASGPTPWTNLSDNPELSGSVSWSGVMWGFSFGDPVGALADLSIALATLDGDLEFTNMGVTPRTGAGFGSAETWGDGDLAYSVGVRGNTFIQTGGDDGVVTGAFFGARHEGMGGTLQRDDLTGAFGGSR